MRTMSKRWLIINALIIAVVLVVISLLVDDAEPFILWAGFLNLLNVIAFSQTNKTGSAPDQARSR
jgi:hypothetical protein